MSINPNAIKPKTLIHIKGFVILSLFDGMSCGQQAINNLGIKEYTYLSSEVDKYAMQVTRYNYPNTIFLGDVTKITLKEYSKTEVIINDKYVVETKNLILIGGSPCQGFSFAGKQKGASTKCNIEITTLEQYLDLKDKQFEFEGQSYLFWEYVRIKETLEKYNSNLIFLLENVKMTEKWKTMFNKAVKNEFVFINSALVSAQNRQRLYWSKKQNTIPQPADQHIYLKDILEFENTTIDKSLFAGKSLQENYRGGNQLNPNYKSQANTIHDINGKCDTLCAGTHGYANGYVPHFKLKIKEKISFSKDGLCHIADAEISGNESNKRVYHPYGKAPALTTCGGGHREPKVLCGNINAIQRSFPKVDLWHTEKDYFTYANKPVRIAQIKDGGQGNRIYSINGKAIALSAQSGGTAGNGNMLIALPNQYLFNFLLMYQIPRGFNKGGIKAIDGKSPTLSSSSWEQNNFVSSHKIPLCGAMRGRYLVDGVRQDGKMKTAGLTKQYIEVRHDQKTNCLTTVQKDNNIVYIEIKDHLNKIVRYEIKDIHWRKLTPIECERLQTVKDNYTALGFDENFKEVKISPTQRYKMLGNGWTVAVIEHLFKHLLKDLEILKNHPAFVFDEIQQMQKAS